MCGAPGNHRARVVNHHNPNGRRRLDDPADFVRLEIETALNRGIPIVTLLVHGARMPDARQLPSTLAPLAQCPTFSVRADTYFQGDMDQVIQAILRWWPALGRWHAPYPQIAALSSLAFVLGGRRMINKKGAFSSHYPS